MGHFSAAVDPVHAFLLACVRSRRQPDALVLARDLAAAPDFDWAALHEVARQELLLPLLCRTLQERDLLPRELEDAWRRLYAGSLQRNSLLLEQLDDVLARLHAIGVAPILLKGAALVRTVYDDAGTRPMADVDLLLREADVPAALRELAVLGYAADEPFSYFGEVVAHKQGRLIADIDLHWNLIGLPHYQKLIPPDWLWQTARPVEAGEVHGLVLGPEAQILHLCAHMVVQHRSEEPRLLWLQDVAEVLHAVAGELDWEELLARGQAYDLVLPLQQVLPVVAADWGAPAPASCLAQLARMQPSQQEAGLARSLQEAGRSPFDQVWAGLVTLPGWRARLRYLGAHLFPAAAYMRNRYRIRHALLTPLYYPWRWADGLASGLAVAAASLRRRLGRHD